MTPERVIEVAIGLYEGPRTGTDAPPRMARAVLAALDGEGLVVVSAEDLRTRVTAVFPDFRDHAGALDRLRAALPERTENG